MTKRFANDRAELQLGMCIVYTVYSTGGDRSREEKKITIHEITIFIINRFAMFLYLYNHTAVYDYTIKIWRVPTPRESDA